uniref:Uncharacterized protein n=1 Tax=Panagrolaimus sp. JU765 TaxID=591449 RepID=A0AC34RAX3_9BILA
MLTQKIPSTLPSKFIRFISNVVPPKIPTDSRGFLVDERSKNERELYDANFRVHRLPKPLRVEIADQKDTLLMTQFLNEHFCKFVSAALAIKIKYEELYPITYRIVKGSVRYPMCPLVFYDGKLVAAYAITYYDETNISKYFPLIKERLNPDAKFIIKEDYADDVKNGPLSTENGNKVFVFLDEMVRQGSKFLPDDCNRIAFAEASAVHHSIKGSRVYNYMFDVIYDLAAKRTKADYMAAISVAKSTHLVAGNVS